MHDEWERIRSQGQRRKFCKANFLSYQRMREWQDLYAQLHGALEELGRFKLNESSADYAAIHRSILPACLHTSPRARSGMFIKASATGNSRLFPARRCSIATKTAEKSARTQRQITAQASINTAAAWIVAGEIVETSQLFARTVAGIDPLWIVQLASHLCQVTYQNPQWSVAAGNVLVDEITTLYGLEIHKVKVSYGKVNPVEATEIFIRSALVEDNLLPSQRRDADDEYDDDDTRILRSTLNRRRCAAVFVSRTQSQGAPES